MGNSSSSGSLNLVVFPPENKDPALTGYYVAGSTVKGAIYAYSTEENASQMNSNVASIEVYFAGKENVKVSYYFEEYYEDEEGERRSRRIPRQAYASRDIFRVTIPLIPNFDGTAGRYEYPFEVCVYECVYECKVISASCMAICGNHCMCDTHCRFILYLSCHRSLCQYTSQLQ
jgi:hypothetical protein